jgi:hypothetical protein
MAQPAPTKRGLGAYMAGVEPRPPRRKDAGGKKGPTTKGRGPPRDKTGLDDDGDAAEAANHRQALQEYRARCQGQDGTGSSWACAQALLYTLQESTIIERLALWFFPSEHQRYLTSCSSLDPTVKSYYVVVRLQGSASLTRLSLGVCFDGTEYKAPWELADPPPSPDPREGIVLRIVSIERDGEPLKRPEDAGPSLAAAGHIKEVVRKHAGKCETLSAGQSLHTRFAVLRTAGYLEAKATLESDDCGPADFERAIRRVEDPEEHPWRLAQRLEEMGLGDRLADACDRLREQVGASRVEVAEGPGIWLVHEEVPRESREFVVAGRWAIQKSIRGTGSIPKAKMWEPVVLSNHQERSEFRLLRMA